MHRRLLVVALAASAIPRAPHAQDRSGLRFTAVVDAVVVDKATGGILLALYVDLPLHEANTRALAARKLATYSEFVQSGRARQQFPEFRESSTRTIEFFHLPAEQPTERETLATLRTQATSAGFAAVFTVLPRVSTR